MTAGNHNTIVCLLHQYPRRIQPETYNERALVVDTPETINNTGFFGSENVIVLSSQDSIIHESPASLAAPIINMIAKNTIKLGMLGRFNQPIPMRLYAPRQLTITTNHLQIGLINFLDTFPESAIISCKKLTLKKFRNEQPEYLEVVKSWLINDDAQIETQEYSGIELRAFSNTENPVR